MGKRKTGCTRSNESSSGIRSLEALKDGDFTPLPIWHSQLDASEQSCEESLPKKEAEYSQRIFASGRFQKWLKQFGKSNCLQVWLGWKKGKG